MVRTCDGKGAKKHKKNTHPHQTLHMLATSLDREHKPKLHLISLHPPLMLFVFPTHMMLPPRQKYTPIITHIF